MFNKKKKKNVYILKSWVEKNQISISRIYSNDYVKGLNFYISSFLKFFIMKFFISKPVTEKSQARYGKGAKKQ